MHESMELTVLVSNQMRARGKGGWHGNYSCCAKLCILYAKKHLGLTYSSALLSTVVRHLS